MKQIDSTLLDSLTMKARGSSRKRAHFNLHPELNDPVQRLCIAMEPETYVRPHRHADPETWEVLLILRGALALNIFDDNGKVVGRTVLNARGPVTAVELSESCWHSPVSLESGTIAFEIKRGPYKQVPEQHLAAWAPAEGDPGIDKFVEWLGLAKVGETPETLHRY